ncbi:unnamed protein product, partial [Hymenolepis diminuta]
QQSWSPNSLLRIIFTVNAYFVSEIAHTQEPPLIAQATYVGVGLKLLQLVSSLLCLTQDTDFIRGEQTIIMAAYMGSRLCDRHMKEYLQTLVCAIRETNVCTYAASILYECMQNAPSMAILLASDDSGYIDCLIGILEFLLQETQPNCNSFTELCNSTMRLIPNADLNDCVAPDGDYVDELS